jgi:hypothetical protein
MCRARPSENSHAVKKQSRALLSFLAVAEYKNRQGGAPDQAPPKQEQNTMSLIQLNKVEGVTMNEDEVATETSKPVFVNPNSIRCFYSRRGGQVGTRITFTDGGGFAVTETPEAVAAQIS